LESFVVEDSFWDFSVRHYGLPGVTDACLVLQDRYGLDVNLLLFCLWYGGRHGEIDVSLLQAVTDFSRAWREQAVEPLRRVRRWIKLERDRLGPVPERLERLRQQVKALELQAEQLQQDYLEQLSESVDRDNAQGCRKAIEHNLRGYLQCLGVESAVELEGLLARVLTGLP
jgi:uncharacterized protein (TIGR02444 family)